MASSIQSQEVDQGNVPLSSTLAGAVTSPSSAARRFRPTSRLVIRAVVDANTSGASEVGLVHDPEQLDDG
jgi:hypothetical protein